MVQMLNRHEQIPTPKVQMLNRQEQITTPEARKPNLLVRSQLNGYKWQIQRYKWQMKRMGSHLNKKDRCSTNLRLSKF